MHIDEATAWLRLALTPGVGPSRTRALLGEFGLPTALFDAEAHSAQRRVRLLALCGETGASALLEPPAPATAAAIARSLDWLAGGTDRSLVCIADTDFPQALLELADAPIVLYAQGRRELLGRVGLAIVGSRNATRQGEQNAAAFAAHLGRAGLCIVSGMASGIDAAAHRGALEAGADTIALLGTGIDCVYPAGNQALSARIAREGLLLSEFALGAAAQPYHFPRRNRLIAALSRGVLVVEAALRSGSLITARLAAEVGREVFAIPGSIHSPLSRGCHRLIRDGAKLVESAQDVLEEMPWRPGAGAAGRTTTRPATKIGADAEDADPDRALAPTAGAALLEALGHDPVDIDTLALRLDRDVGTVAALLLELELERSVERLPGNRYQRLR
jgi:DNA processing protein